MSHATASEFVDHTVESAPEGSRAALRATAKQFGFIPAAMARLAESPSLVEAFTATLRIFDRSSLAPLEREVLVLTLAQVVGCEVCVAIHTATLQALHPPAALVEALAAGSPLPDARLEALRLFTRAVIDTRGDVSADDGALAAFLAAGFTRRHALDVVLGVGTYTLSTYANRMTRAGVTLPPAST
jgi:AhpD family alkylhydroperoxidase